MVYKLFNNIELTCSFLVVFILNVVYALLRLFLDFILGVVYDFNFIVFVLLDNFILILFISFLMLGVFRYLYVLCFVLSILYLFISFIIYAMNSG